MRGILQIAETTVGAKTIMFRSDAERALSSLAMRILKERGLKLMTSAAYSPQQNGAAEAAGKSIVIRARCIVSETGLPQELWPWIVHAAVYLLNRTPNPKVGMKTPYEAVTGKKPYLGHLHPIGCKAFAVIRNGSKQSLTDKLADRAHVGYHLGYADSTNIFYVWVPKLRKVLRTRDVYFKDNEVYNPQDIDNMTLGEVVPPVSHDLIVQRIELPEDTNTKALRQKEWGIETLESYKDTFDKRTAANEKQWERAQEIEAQVRQLNKTPYPTPSLTSGQRNTKNQDNRSNEEPEQENQTYAIHFLDTHSKEIFLGDDEPSEAVSITREGKDSKDAIPRIHNKYLPPPPTSWKEMEKHEYSSNWLLSSKQEMDKLFDYGTFERVKGYKGHQIPLKWVWTYKLDEDGWLDRFKARLCVRGDLQLPTIQDTYAATLAYKVLRAFCALIAAYDLNTMQFDVVNAFPHAELNHDVYCRMPQGMEEEGICLKLRRALYGLAESPKLWYNLLVHELEEYGFKHIPGVKCLMYGHGMWVLFYVDDIGLSYFPKDEEKAQNFRKFLSQRFEIKYKGELKWFLGLEILRDREAGKLWISQRTYIEKLGTKFHLAGKDKYYTVPIPNTTAGLVKNTEQATKATIQGYQVKVGSIGHAAVATRPDIAKAHSVLAQFLQNPSEKHCGMADHVLNYLYGTRGLALFYDVEAEELEIFTDASFADHQDRKSSQGLLVKMFGGAVDWKATKQKTITTSTTEAELLALSTMAGYAYWWRRLFEGLELDISQESYTVYCDNSTAVKIAKREEDTERTALRHVDIRQQWIIQEVEAGRLKVEWVPTGE